MGEIRRHPRAGGAQSDYPPEAQPSGRGGVGAGRHKSHNPCGAATLKRTLPPVKLSPAFWEEIARSIKRRADPQDTKDFIIATLRRQEAVVIPSEVQLYIAELLAASEVKRSASRPKLTIEQRTLAAIDLVERIEEMAAGNTREAAFEEVARTSRLKDTTIKRKYRAALRELRSWPDFAASHPPRRKN